MDVLLRVLAGSEAADGVMNFPPHLIRPSWLCLFAKDSHRSDVGCQDTEILRASGANPLAVQTDFKGDHGFGELFIKREKIPAKQIMIDKLGILS